MATIPFVWSNDDICHGQSVQLARQLEMLDRLGIPGVFFVIPRVGGDLDKDADLLRMIEKARGRGHEFYQHGFVHTAFECGVPETWMMGFHQVTLDEYDQHREKIEESHTLEALVRMLDSGQKIWRRAFGEDSPGFRPGWGAFCDNFYKALHALDYQWVSARIPSATSWRWNRLQWDAPREFRAGFPLKAYKVHGVTEHPITGGDYGFTVPNEPDKIETMVNLGLYDLDYLHKQQAPMLMVSHWHGLERNGGTGYAVHEKLLPAILKSGKVEPMGLAELHRRQAAQ